MFVSFFMEEMSGRSELSLVAQVSKNWISPSTNGALQMKYGKAVAGGAIRNGKGEWIMRCNRDLGNCSIFNAEL